MDIQRIEKDGDIEACFETMHFLRPHLKQTEFLEKTKRQLTQGYNLVAVSKQEFYGALIGFRILEFMAWGKVLYIDDLITHPEHLKQGYASQLLDWVVSEAKTLGCDEVHLDSGYQRNDAHRLYLNKGFDLVSHHFAKKLS